MIIARFSKLYFALIIMPALFSFNHPQKIIFQLSIDQANEASVSNIENEIFVYINLHRKLAGLKPLQLSNVESSAASQHSNNMASGKISFGHDGFSKRIQAIADRLGSIDASAENVAFGQMTAKQVVDVWLQSPRHRKNIEGDFTLTGIGVAEGKRGMIYYTEIFTR